MYLARDIPAFVMYCVYGTSRSSLLNRVYRLYDVLYSGKLSREKGFAFFAVSEPSVKVFSSKFCIPQCARCVYAGVLRMREGHTYIIIGTEQSAKVFSSKFSFCTETRKFSPAKVFRYTVILANRPGISGAVPDFAQLSRRPGNANYCPGNWVNRRDRKLRVGALAIHARPKRAPDQN